MMRSAFRQEKTTQAACLLLRLAGGSMNLVKLIKLLYLVDRQALTQWGRSLSNDDYVSMDKGPVLSRTYNLIKRDGDCEYWSRYVSERDDKHDVHLLAEDAPRDYLSRADVGLIQDIFRRYGSLDQWDLVELAHDFPEWENPEGSACSIRIEDILRAVGKSQEEIEEIEEEINAVSFARTFFE